MNSTEILARLISFDTTSANSNLELMNFIGKYLSQHNVKSQLIFNDDKSKANLYASIGSEAVLQRPGNDQT